MAKSKLNRFVQICLDIAEYYDTMGEEADSVLEDKMLKELGLGYRALTGYLRNGVKEVIELEDNKHTLKEYNNSMKFDVEAVRKIEELLDPDIDSKEAIQKIRDILSE